MPHTTARIVLFLTAAMFCICGCTSLRTEFYREETSYLYASGCEAYKERDFETAQKQFTAIIDVDPGFGQAYAGLGNIALVRNDYEAASRYYLQAMQGNPDFRKRLLPMYLSLKTASTRQPLLSKDLSLARIHGLLASDQLYAVEALVDETIPLQLLATDSLSLSPKQLVDLRKLVAKYADTPELELSPTLQLLFAQILFIDSKYDPTTLELLSTASTTLTGPRQAGAYLLLGRVYKRLEKPNQAIKAFATALQLGTPIEDAAPYLSAIYRQPEREITERHNQPRSGHRLPHPSLLSLATTPAVQQAASDD